MIFQTLKDYNCETPAQAQLAISPGPPVKAVPAHLYLEPNGG